MVSLSNLNCVTLELYSALISLAVILVHFLIGSLLRISLTFFMRVLSLFRILGVQWFRWIHQIIIWWTWFWIRFNWYEWYWFWWVVEWGRILYGCGACCLWLVIWWWWRFICSVISNGYQIFCTYQWQVIMLQRCSCIKFTGLCCHRNFTNL